MLTRAGGLSLRKATVGGLLAYENHGAAKATLDSQPSMDGQSKPGNVQSRRSKNSAQSTARAPNQFQIGRPVPRLQFLPRTAHATHAARLVSSWCPADFHRAKIASGYRRCSNRAASPTPGSSGDPKA